MTIRKEDQAGETKTSLMVADFEKGAYKLSDITADFFKLLKDLGLTDAYICEKLGTHNVALGKFKNEHGLKGYGNLAGKKHEFSANDTIEKEVSAIKEDLAQSVQPIPEAPKEESNDKSEKAVIKLHKQIEELESSKNSLSFENKRLKEQNNQLRASIQPEQDSKALEDQIRELRLENSSLINEVKAVEKSKRDIQEEHHKLKSSYEAMKKEEAFPLSTSEMNELLQVDTEKEELRARIQELEKGNALLKTENSNLKQDKLALSLDLESYKSGVSKAKYDNLMAAYNELQRINNSLKDGEVLLKKNLSEANLHSRALEAKVEELEAKLQAPSEASEPAIALEPGFSNDEREELIEKLNVAKYTIKNIMFLTDF